MSYSQQRNKRIKEIFSSLPRGEQMVLERMVDTFNIKGFGITGFLDLVIALWGNDEARGALERGEFGRDTIRGGKG